MDELLQDTETEALMELRSEREALIEPPDATGEQPEAQPAVGKTRGRPKSSKDAHPRSRTKPETHTPSKAYVETESPLLHLEEAMADARQQELINKHNLYQSWLPY